jgi:hypothetical protein
MNPATSPAAARARQIARQAAGTPADRASGPPRAIKRQQWRALKRSIVEAATSGAISPERASGMIARFGLRDL